ncbi:MAG: flagellar hook capping family protein [Alphaproteobacteria bacterium]|nr:flagellar hook capping family protein [Alphaproteobacteria bacterium]
MVSDVSFSSALQEQQQTASASASLAEDFSQFLTLLTTQLQNQDPLDPLDTNEMTNQLVAFTGVEQQINTNQKLDDLVSLQLGNALGSSLGYVGLDISYVGSEFYSDGETPVTINYALDGQAIENNLSIVNEEGITVYETSGSTAAGAQEFVWDGKDNFGNPVPPGTYAIRIDALNGQEEAVGGSTIVSGRVKGVESQNGVLFLIVGERAVALSNVLNARDPGTVVPDEGGGEGSGEEEGGGEA